MVPLNCVAESFAPLRNNKYLCTQKGVTGQGAEVSFSLSLKNKNKTLAGKKSWTYASLNSKIVALEKSKQKSKGQAKADKALLRQLKTFLGMLLNCYDTKSLPRPGAHPPIVQPTATPPTFSVPTSTPTPARTPTPTASSTPTQTPTSPPTGVGFDSVRPILEANCMGCHLARGWTLSEAYFLQNGYVAPGHATQSNLYRYLRDNPDNVGPRTMPASGSPLSQSDIIAIRNWIDGIAPPVGATPTPTPSGHFTCFPNVEVAPSKMKRITRLQLQNSLYDLLYLGLQNVDLTRYYVIYGPGFEWGRIPEDFSPTGHARLDDRTDAFYLEGTFALFEFIARKLVDDGRMPSFVPRYVPSCTPSTYGSETCVNQFVRNFGRRVLKRTLSQEDVDFYRRPDANGHTQATYYEILLRLLSAPEFLYRLEVRGTPTDGTGLVLRVSGTEYVSRLAYTLWNSLPDNQLLTYGEDGAVDNHPEIVLNYVLEQQQVRTRAGFAEFFDGWLKIKHTLDEIATYFEVDEVAPYVAAFDYGRNDQQLVDPPNSFSRALLNYRYASEKEILDLGTILTFVSNAPVSELFRTRLAPVQDEVQRRIYHMPALWDGNVQNVPLGPDTRKGILTRPAFHLARGDRNRVIIRGRRIREDILCDTTGIPANNSTPEGVNTRSFEYLTGTTQYRTRQVTERPGTNCVSCHQNYLNPLGFALEDYDPLGRRRSGEEVVRMSYNNGPVTEYRNQYDTNVIPRINREDLRPVSGPDELSARIADSDEMHACFTRNLLRFAYDRPEEESFDGCLMNDIFEDSKVRSMKEVLQRMFLSPRYRLRRRDSVFTP